MTAVCPDCRGRLEREAGGGLACAACRNAFPKRSAAVDVLLSEPEWNAAVRMNASKKEALDLYLPARRFPLAGLYYDWWAARMWAKVPAGAGEVLELMCGGLELASRMPATIRKVIGLDLNARLLESALGEIDAAKRSRIELVCGTASRIPLASSSVDAVLVMGGFHHVRPIMPEVLGEIRRVLKPGGRLVASEPANDHWLNRAVRRWQYRTSPLQGKDEGEDGFTRQELGGILAANGLELGDYDLFGFIAYPLLGNMDLLPALARSRNGRLGRWLIGLDEWIEKTPLLRRMAWANLFTATATRPSSAPKNS